MPPVNAAPDAYKDRLKTILEPTKEGSANSRLRAWGIATRMALDHPVFGVGMYKFRQHYREYAPDRRKMSIFAWLWIQRSGS